MPLYATIMKVTSATIWHYRRKGGHYGKAALRDSNAADVHAGNGMLCELQVFRTTLFAGADR